MNISSFAEAFVPLLKQNKLIHKRESNNNNIMLSLFKDLLEAEKYVQKCIISSSVVASDQAKENITLNNNGRFFPKAIRKYIQDTPYSLFKYSCKIKDRENNLYFYSYPETIDKDTIDKDTINIKKYVNTMFMWLYICDKYSEKKCAKVMNIHIYLTPFKKTLPSSKTTVLSAEHVNTAFTYCCTPEGEITIFRAEEWFKVFLHESFHAYNLDFGLAPDSTALRRIVGSVFRVKSYFDVNEAYTETWARIINCALYSFMALSARERAKYSAEGAKTFLIYTDFCLQLERLFSLFQMNKILNFMGLNYTDLYLPEAYLKQPLYKEDTHVFGYYILTALFLNDYNQFMQWCSVNNASASVSNNIMKFKCTEESFQQMGAYIKAIYNSPNLLERISSQHILKKTSDDYIKTSRMAIIDMTDI